MLPFCAIEYNLVNSIQSNRLLYARAELTRFEKNNRSDEELYYMEKGIEILKKNGISVLEINNCTELDKNVDTIVEHIVKEVKRK